MIHEVKFIGWPYPWNETLPGVQIAWLEMMDSIAEKMNGIVHADTAVGPIEEIDHDNDVVIWTWRLQLDRDPRQPME